MNCEFLILDLDDTIYPIRSIDASVAEPFLHAIADSKHLSQKQLAQARNEAWILPFHQLVERYGLGEEVVQVALHTFSTLDQLEIEPFPDYDLLRRIDLPMYLVTSGITQFQRLKISSLGVGSDFKAILIDDPMEGVKGGKKALFKQLLRDFDHDPQAGLVIGDNIHSELQAAEKIGLRAVLIDRENRYGSNVPSWLDYQFDDFHQLIQTLGPIS